MGIGHLPYVLTSPVGWLVVVPRLCLRFVGGWLPGKAHNPALVINALSIAHPHDFGFAPSCEHGEQVHQESDHHAEQEQHQHVQFQRAAHVSAAKNLDRDSAAQHRLYHFKFTIQKHLLQETQYGTRRLPVLEPPIPQTEWE